MGREAIKYKGGNTMPTKRRKKGVSLKPSRFKNTVTLDQVRNLQGRFRSNRAKAQDALHTSKRVISSSDEYGMARWFRSPGRFDVSGVDTKGAPFTKTARKVSIRPSYFASSAADKRFAKEMRELSKGRRKSKRK